MNMEGLKRVLNPVQPPTCLIREVMRSKKKDICLIPCYRNLHVICCPPQAKTGSKHLNYVTDYISSTRVSELNYCLKCDSYLFVEGFPLLTYSIHTVLLFFSVIFDPWKWRNLIFLEVALPTLSLICLFTLKENGLLIKPENASVPTGKVSPTSRRSTQGI
jgi:hypothetical protein